MILISLNQVFKTQNTDFKVWSLTNQPLMFILQFNHLWLHMMFSQSHPLDRRWESVCGSHSVCVCVSSKWYRACRLTLNLTSHCWKLQPQSHSLAASDIVSATCESFVSLCVCPGEQRRQFRRVLCHLESHQSVRMWALMWCVSAKWSNKTSEPSSVSETRRRTSDQAGPGGHWNLLSLLTHRQTQNKNSPALLP